VNSGRFAMAMGVGIGAIATLLWLLSSPGTPVTAGPALSAPSVSEASTVEESAESPLSDATPLHYVAITGTDSGDCSTPGSACLTIQYAMDQAGEGDEIRIASGVYTGVSARQGVTQVVYISKTVTVRGGYTTTNGFADSPNPVANPTTLDAQREGRVLYITGDISPTVEGLCITGGDAAKGGGASPVGGGVYINTATAIIHNNQVFSNTADTGGGLYLVHSAATVSGNTVASNAASSCGGGLYLNNSKATISGNLIMSNSASYRGGGLDLVSYSDATVTNNVIAGNQTDAIASGVHIGYSSPRLLHNTIARNLGGDGWGVYINKYESNYSTVAMTNTILVSHNIGIYIHPGNTATLESILWHGNTTNWSGAGTINNSNDYSGDPAFVNPDAGDYHIGINSAALDTGINAGITTDIDNEPRPVGEGYDIGADEFPVVRHLVYLPLVMKRWPPIPYTPVLNPIDNTDQDGYYAVTWQKADLATTYILEEATNASFSGAQVVYQGDALSWSVPSPGKMPGTYYYRVKARNTWADSPWSNVQQVVIHPLFVGLELRWDGDGYIRGSRYYDIGYHETKDLNDLTDADTVRVHSHAWYSPNPLDFDSETWDSYYSVSTGHFKSSSVPSDPSWKWGYPWILPYDWQFSNGQVFWLGGQAFTVSGPHSGYTAWGQAIQYWQLVNRDKFLYWDGGGDWKQYVHSGDITLRYDAGSTRLLLHDDILRRYYYKGQQTSDTVQYIINLTEANAFPSGVLLKKQTKHFGALVFHPSSTTDELDTVLRESFRASEVLAR